MAKKEKQTKQDLYTQAGWQPTGKKGFWYKDKILMQKMGFGKTALLASLRDTTTVRSGIDRLGTHDDAVKRYYFTDGEMCVITRARKPQKVIDLAERVDQNLKDHKAVHVCHRCGSEHNLHVCLHDEEADVICGDCFAEIQSHPQEHKSDPAGILSEILALAIPCILWVMLHGQGYIVSLLGIVFGMASFKGFEALGRYVDRKGWLMLVLTDLIGLFIAQYFVLGMTIKNVMMSTVSADITLAQALSVVPAVIDIETIVIMGVYLGLNVFLSIIVWIILARRYKNRHILMNVCRVVD